jgi:hypothetical protein
LAKRKTRTKSFKIFELRGYVQVTLPSIIVSLTGISGITGDTFLSLQCTDAAGISTQTISDMWVTQVDYSFNAVEENIRIRTVLFSLQE